MDQMNCPIPIAQKIAAIVSSRDLVQGLKKEITKKKYPMVSLDFTGVEFISRSAAHELVTLQEEMRTKKFKKKEVHFIHTNTDIKKMLRLVAANKAVPEKPKPVVRLEKVDIQSLLEAALNS